MRRLVANLVLWFLGLLPAVIFLTTTAVVDWQSTAAVLNTLGRLAGVAGLSFMLVAAMLSSRVPGYDKLFGGLTKLWFSHHQLAAVSFLLLLMHPLLLAFAGVTVSVDVGFSVLFPDKNSVPVTLGWLSLIVMMIFLAPGFHFFGEPKYQRWKWLHKLAGVALLLALIHTFMLTRQANHRWESIIFGLYVVLAVSALMYRWGFSRLRWFGRHGRLPYQVVDVTHPVTSVVELELRPEKEALVYEPGQFIYFTPYDKHLRAGYGEEHPYTISSEPAEANLRIAVKDLGDASRALQSIQMGSPVRVEGPYGAFLPAVYDGDSELWIAGGIGVTPFLSRARHFATQGAEVDVHCILCVQDEARALYREELQTIAEKLPGFEFRMHYFYRQGPITVDFVEAGCPDFVERSCYVCGPPGMLKCVQRFLHAAGLPKKRVHTEEFDLL